jgi:hypothetical protein
VAVKGAVLLRLGTGRNLVLILVILSVCYFSSLDSFFYPEAGSNWLLKIPLPIYQSACCLIMEDCDLTRRLSNLMLFIIILR